MKFRADLSPARRSGAGALRAAAAILVLALLMAPGVPAAERYRTNTPLETIETLHQGLVQLSAQTRNADLEQRYEQLRPLVDATHDLPYIAQITIRSQWRELSPEQRQAFVEAFGRLSVMTYASRFANLTPDALQIVDSAEAAADRAEVTATIVRPDADDIPLEYVLRREDDGWRIVNIVADGVSDLALKRAEYQRVLADGSFERLLRHLDEQTARLR